MKKWFSRFAVALGVGLAVILAGTFSFINAKHVFVLEEYVKDSLEIDGYGFYNTFSDIPTAAVTNGDATHVPTCDGVFDFCETTQDYLKTSENSDSDDDLSDDDIDALQNVAALTEVKGNILVYGTNWDVLAPPTGVVRLLQINADSTFTWTTTSAGDITAVGNGATGAVFTADGTGDTLWLEGLAADAYELLITSATITGSDKTATFPNATGEVSLLGQTIEATEIATGEVGDDEIDYSAVTLDDFDYQTAWRIFYSNTDGDVTELALGANGTFLESNGAAAAPAFRALEAADIPDISATYEVQLDNEAGLYAVLSDVSDFVQPAELVGANETYGAGWDADVGLAEKDDIYDYLHQIDTNDDGDVDNVDAAVLAAKQDTTWVADEIFISAEYTGTLWDFNGDNDSVDVSADYDNTNHRCYYRVIRSDVAKGTFEGYGFVCQMQLSSDVEALDSVGVWIRTLQADVDTNKIDVIVVDDGTDVDSLNNQFSATGETWEELIIEGGFGSVAGGSIMTVEMKPQVTYNGYVDMNGITFYVRKVR